MAHKKGDRQPREDHFWVFVDLEAADGPPDFWILTDKWVVEHVKTYTDAWRERHKEKYNRKPEPPHFGVLKNRLHDDDKGAWGILGLDG